jgi:hypothetical protein
VLLVAVDEHSRANSARDAVRRAQRQSARAAEAPSTGVPVPSQPAQNPGASSQLPPPPPPLFPSPFRSALEVVGMHHTHDMAQLLGQSPAAATSADASSDPASTAPPCFHCTVRTPRSCVLSLTVPLHSISSTEQLARTHRSRLNEGGGLASAGGVEIHTDC